MLPYRVQLQPRKAGSSISSAGGKRERKTVGNVPIRVRTQAHVIGGFQRSGEDAIHDRRVAGPT